MPLPSGHLFTDASVIIRSEDVQQMLREAPKVFNGSYNRALRRIGGTFGRKFTNERLSGGSGIRIRRKGRFGGAEESLGAKAVEAGGRADSGFRTHPTLPRRMVLAGFKARILVPQQIEGKGMQVYTKSPVMESHEKGGTISAKGKSLRIRFSKISKGLAAIKGYSTKRADEIWKSAQIVKIKGRTFLIAKDSTGKVEKMVPLAHLKRSIRMRARLGFEASWKNYSPEAIRRLKAAQDEAAKRLEFRRAALTEKAGGE
jgi:hypothetical protein